MSRDIKSNGTPITILGQELKTGDKAPDFVLIKNDMTEAKLQDFIGKPVIMSIVPSVDTPVCSIETRRFNNEATKHKNVTFLTISKDLPFAQARWCAAQDVKDLITLSDYRNPDFGLDYGVLIKETALLTRAVYVLDNKGIIQYIEFVEDISKEPDYKAAIDAAEALV
ncbi:thiol peroxidase [Elusimicrobium simillimum]|uniref:thiol peroxidase n=1 Tax=Elusimicrobium simillimum TaxID=3143438 RepID=UPI003C6EA817